MILGNAMPLAVPQIIVLPLNVLEYVGPHHAVGWGECEEEEWKEGHRPAASHVHVTSNGCGRRKEVNFVPRRKKKLLGLRCLYPLYYYLANSNTL
jgi:hypothetical protein